jgi:SAM-dependent methyltransferase
VNDPYRLVRFAQAATGWRSSWNNAESEDDVSEPTLEQQIDAATAYEQLMVPALFGQWAEKVVDAAGIQPGQRVLDVACGTGVLGREALSRTGAAGFVAGLDANPGMLEVARRRAPAVEWRRGSAESLPFAEGSFDAVVSQFGLMFFGDRRRALREALRVLVPAGRLAFAVWDALENIPAYAAVVELLERTAGRRAADALRTPFVLGDRDELLSSFGDAGVASIDVATHEGIGRFPSARVMVEADLRGWLPVVGIVLPEEEITRILEEAERVLERYVTADGTIAFGLSAHVVKGTKT